MNGPEVINGGASRGWYIRWPGGGESWMPDEATARACVDKCRGVATAAWLATALSESIWYSQETQEWRIPRAAAEYCRTGPDGLSLPSLLNQCAEQRAAMDKALRDAKTATTYLISGEARP